MDHGQLPIWSHPLYGFLQRYVGRDVYHLQLVGDEHHRVILGAGELGEDLSVPRVLVTRQVHSFLVQRSGRYRPNAPAARQLRRPLHAPERRVSRPRVELAERQLLRELAHREHVYGVRLEGGLLRLGDRVDAKWQFQKFHGTSEDRRVSDDEGPVFVSEARIGEGFGDYLGSDPRRVSHRDGYEGRVHEFFPLVRSFSTIFTSVPGSPKPPALVT